MPRGLGDLLFRQQRAHVEQASEFPVRFVVLGEMRVPAVRRERHFSEYDTSIHVIEIDSYQWESVCHLRSQVRHLGDVFRKSDFTRVPTRFVAHGKTCGISIHIENHPPMVFAVPSDVDLHESRHPFETVELVVRRNRMDAVVQEFFYDDTRRNRRILPLASEFGIVFREPILQNRANLVLVDFRRVRDDDVVSGAVGALDDERIGQIPERQKRRIRSAFGFFPNTWSDDPGSETFRER